MPPHRYPRKRRKKRRNNQPTGDLQPAGGVLEVYEKGFGFLRDLKRNFAIRPEDAYVEVDMIRRHSFRGGEYITGQAAPTKNKQGRDSLRMFKLETINGIPLDDWRPPIPLEESTAIDPNQPIRFDTPDGPLSTRIIELFTPIGFGQRGLIVAPPRTGKTVLLQHMAHGVSTNHPDAYMVVLLIDERPEEVTEMRRQVHGDVIASSNDLDMASHIRVARLTIARARRLAESGTDVVILLDSITRLARAFNSYIGSSGRTMTGGLDIKALQEPKQIFGSARNIEGGGSLTIIATALVDTGSRADEFIFQEFKGTGNMELVLDRDLANMRIWPAIDLRQSGTRKEEKLLEDDTLQKQYLLRRHLGDLPPAKQITTLTERMGKHKDLADFLTTMRAS